MKQPADFRTKLLDLGFEGMHLKFRDKEWHSQLLGEFNAYNLTAVLAVALELGMNETEVLYIVNRKVYGFVIVGSFGSIFLGVGSEVPMISFMVK